MRHNNVIPNGHWHKHWDRDMFRTWFDQPGQKKRRRLARRVKAAQIAPRPVDGHLRPAVRAPTAKYNTKMRSGRGFSLEELKGAGIKPLFARTIGIAVDHRRRNRSVQSLETNVKRLKTYRSKLILFPKKSGKKAMKKYNPEDLKTATQRTTPLNKVGQGLRRIRAQKITEEQKKGSVFHKLRVTQGHARVEGLRLKRNAEKATKEAMEGKKQSKKEAKEDKE